MPYYEYECEHETYLRYYPMGEAAPCIACLVESGCTPRRVYSFQHIEDRRHMRKGISAATGLPVAQSRSEERRIERERGIEFIGRKEMPSDWKRMGEYARHVKSGGDRVDPELVNPTKLESTKGSLLKKVRERGISLGS